jgi:hypothetical protein
MKPATIAPAYACIYPGLCEIAREHGYALAIHGSVARDLDLIAIPWRDENILPAEQLVNKLTAHLGACLYPDLLRRSHVPESHIEQILARPENAQPAIKPHGRLAWNIHLDAGCKVDLSVMPIVERA